MNCIVTENIITAIHSNGQHDAAVIGDRIINIVKIAAIDHIITSPHLDHRTIGIPEGRFTNDVICATGSEQR